MQTNTDEILEQVKNDEILMLQSGVEELRDVTEAALQEAQVGNWRKAFTMLWLVATAKAKNRSNVQPIEKASSKKVSYEQAQ